MEANATIFKLSGDLKLSLPIYKGNSTLFNFSDATYLNHCLTSLLLTHDLCLVLVFDYSKMAATGGRGGPVLLGGHCTRG